MFSLFYFFSSVFASLSPLKTRVTESESGKPMGVTEINPGTKCNAVPLLFSFQGNTHFISIILRCQYNGCVFMVVTVLVFCISERDCACMATVHLCLFNLFLFVFRFGCEGLCTSSKLTLKFVKDLNQKHGLTLLILIYLA